MREGKARDPGRPEPVQEAQPPCPALLPCPAALPCQRPPFPGQIKPYQFCSVKSAFFIWVGKAKASQSLRKPLEPASPSLQSSCEQQWQGANGRSVCWKTLSSRRAAGTGREDLQPHTNPSQLWFALKCGHLMQSCEGKQRARKPPLRGFRGRTLNPNWE